VIVFYIDDVVDMDMITKAREKLEELKERRAENRAGRRREERLAKLEKYCIENDLGYHPVLVSELPDYAPVINDYILKKGQSDLRRSQFEKYVPEVNLLDMMEIGGMLEWKDGENPINEIRYNRPICCNETVYDNPVEMNLEYLLNNGSAIHTYENLIGWHSQTLGIGQLTEGDVRKMVTLKKEIGDKPYYHVIFSTTTDQFFWYALEKDPEIPRKYLDL
jgi:hypothetical protein